VRKVLLITYYWPPSGGSGVQRCLKFAKYLIRHGWQPVVFTADNAKYPVYDHSLEKEVPDGIEVLKVSAREPHGLYNRLAGGGENQTHTGFIKHKKKESLFEKLAVWIRGNLFIPDSRKFWISPSVKFLEHYLRENPVDLIFSSGPPHSAHLIARRLKEKISVPWVADFRDPWTGIYYYRKLRLSAYADRLNRKLEKKCLNSADRIVVVGETMRQDFEKITNKPVHVITNGFDPDDYNNLNRPAIDRFRITYTGMFSRDQNPEELWDALCEMKKSIPGFSEDLEICLAGRIDREILESIASKGLDTNLRIHGYVLKSKLPEIQAISALLLLSINRVENASYIITGKIFEYLAVQRPILAFCPEKSDVDNIIRETAAGWTIPFNKKEKVLKVINEIYRKYKDGTLHLEEVDIDRFSREELAGNLARLFVKTVNLYKTKLSDNRNIT